MNVHLTALRTAVLIVSVFAAVSVVAWFMDPDTFGLVAYSAAAFGLVTATLFGTLRTWWSRGWRSRVFILTYFFWSVGLAITLRVALELGLAVPAIVTTGVQVNLVTSVTCLLLIVRRPTLEMYRAWRDHDEPPDSPPPDTFEGIVLGPDKRDGVT